MSAAIDFRETFAALARDVEIVSAETVLVAGVPIAVPRATGQRDADPSSAWLRVVDALALALYPEHYCRGTPRSERSPGAGPPNGPGLLDALSAANASRSRWSTRWTVLRAENDGRVLVRRDGWTRWVAAGGYLARSGSRPRVSPGDEVHVYRPRDSVDAANGFYFSFGEAVQGDHDASDVVRVYVATTAAGAVRATASLSTRLNRLRVPFSMKSLDRPEAYWRADATVLYVPWWNLRLALHEVEAFRIAAPDDVRDVTPLFTQRVAPGVAVAEDPADGSSFGVSRCRLVAEGLVRAHRLRERDPWGRAEITASVFRARGVDPAEPHRSHSRGHVEWPGA